MENALRGTVLEKHPSITAFANAMHWDRKKASRIINRVQRPTAEDMEAMAEDLGILDADKFMAIFFPNLPQCGKM